MEPRSLSFAEARARVLGAVRPLLPMRAALADAAGRPLRDDVRAPHALPPFDNSAMDGYAVRTADLAAGPVELPVSYVVRAGWPPPGPLEGGTVARIMTGAMLPAGADAVVPFEDCERITEGGGERVRFSAPVRPGSNVRPAGADIAGGAIALEEGRELTPHDVALLAALGEAWIPVGPKPRVAIVSTGDELLDVENALRPGAIRDSNALMLGALARDAGCDVVSIERVPDAPAVVVARVRRALDASDVAITIGGVSAGDYDPVKESLEAIPGAELWRVAMKPGRPQAFAAGDASLYFGLPGNPASVACVFETLVRPALRRLQGFAVVDRPRVRVRAAERIESRRGRTDFVRVRLRWRDGGWWAAPAGAQISGHLTPQARAHALLIVAEDRDEVAAGAAAPALLLRWPNPAGDGREAARGPLGGGGKPPALTRR